MTHHNDSGDGRRDAAVRHALDEHLRTALGDGLAPCAVALVADRERVLYQAAHGVLATATGSRVAGQPCTTGTVFDLASLTKVLATTTLYALQHQRQNAALDLEAALPADYAHCCPGATIRDLFEHASGLVAHREYFADPRLRGVDAILAAVRETAPGYPRRSTAIYSDLGFMILGRLLHEHCGTPLDQLFRERVGAGIFASRSDEAKQIDGPLPPEELAAGTAVLGFRASTKDPTHDIPLAQIAPTECYPPDTTMSWGRVRRLDRGDAFVEAHGEVHDDNAWAMGGVAGHAGLFGNASGVLALARVWLGDVLASGLQLHAETRTKFTTRSTVPQSTRALGWDLAAPSSSCSELLSPASFGHTGYTGTSLWIDPAPGRERIYVLLTNRVHPARERPDLAAHTLAFRRTFHRLAHGLDS